nr:MAG TPA: hypothetical protein [Caudoviricetes sp.]DAM06196.1 MAG TPA: hypothetical protein [Bacteriophage sp.]DAN99833.1 MAG TPA: hypothetical protein [Caudoviricetes sp.]DAO92990.1 MAG TPA: hypothetical protein [Caudoviricetes sp.]DAR40438.1 MAG TPA: hypothetical protein [Caudoviricetes sp.]
MIYSGLTSSNPHKSISIHLIITIVHFWTMARYPLHILSSNA